jgi:putative ABC transport system permease protein
VPSEVTAALTLVREGVAHARQDRRFTVALALVVALVVAVVLATAGRNAATERSVVDSIETLGARTVVLTDSDRRATIDSASISNLLEIDGVTWVFGMGPAHAGHNAGLPTQGSVTTRSLVGQLPSVVEVSTGRAPESPGEAVVGREAAAALGLVDVSGAVAADGMQLGVVGQMRAEGMLAFLDETVLYRAEPAAQEPVVQIYLNVEDPAYAQAIGDEAVARLVAERPESVTVEVSSSVIQLSAVVSGDLGESSRQVMAIVLLVGLAITTVVTLAMTSNQRRNFGRMRALGASRTALVVIVLVHVAVAAAAGAVLGSAVGLAIVAATMDGVLPAWTFVVGVGLDALLIALVGAALPAVAAARRDPISILRVP